MEITGHPPPPFWGESKFQHLDQPVVGPNWYDAVAYCEWIKNLIGKAYRLPTEAEREKAARADWKAESIHGAMNCKRTMWADGMHRIFRLGRRGPTVMALQYVRGGPRMVR